METRKKLRKFLFGAVLALVFTLFLQFLRIPSTKPSISTAVICSDKFESANNNAKLTIANSASWEEKGSNLVFIGVMTAAKYLDSRAKAVYDTWGKNVPGKLEFFSSEFSHSTSLPLVALANVDDTYPPQRKSFMMLKHMHDHHLNDFEWFVRADDDVYVRTDRLELFLRSIDSRKAWFIGQTGRGKLDEFGRLALESDENFCMGGPGIIMSRETLRKLAPYLHLCLDELYTTHEDVELGRCIRRFVGISCTWSYEMQVILYHNQSGEMAFGGDLKQKEVHRAITLHPVKTASYMYRLHDYLKGLEVQELRHKTLNLHRDLAKSMAELGYNRDELSEAKLDEGLPLFFHQKGHAEYLGDTEILGAPKTLTRHKPKDIANILEWEQINKSLYSHKDANPRRKIPTSIRQGLADVVREIMEDINRSSKQRGRIIDYNDILYGYWRLDPIHGVDLILDLLLMYRKFRGPKMSVRVRRHTYVQRTFTAILIKELTLPPNTPPPPPPDTLPVHQKFVKDLLSTFESNFQALPIFNTAKMGKNTLRHTTINFILPLSGRYNIFVRFIENFLNVYKHQDDAINLFILLYENDNEESRGDFERTKNLVERVKIENRVGIVYQQIVDEPFSRARAIDLGTKLVADDALMLFIDVDMVFDHRALQRIRQNTAENRTIYFPIVYSMYNPKLKNQKTNDSAVASIDPFVIDEVSGFWRQFGFGIVSLYKSDYQALGGFNLTINGWGFEDVNLYEKAIASVRNYAIIRSADPGLVHVYHPINCDKRLGAEQMNMCMKTKFSMIGSVCRLSELYEQNKHLFR